MKKPDGTALAGRKRIARFGVRARIFLYFLLFSVVLVVLLWLFQIVFLDDFYRMLKTRMIESTADLLVRNIENEDLQALVDRVSQENDVCALVLNADYTRRCSAEAQPNCIIHHLSEADIERHVRMARDAGGTFFQVFSIDMARNRSFNPSRYVGRVPKYAADKASIMICVRAVKRLDGSDTYVFLNAAITPVNATVQTLRDQLYIISGMLLLLAFLLSLLLSKRVTRPIVSTTVAARELSHGAFQPDASGISYREIEELNATLSRAAAELSRVETLQRDLIANISHDLRTPLTLVEGYAEAMRDLPDENTPENMQVIIDETRRLSSLVSALLDYSRLESGAAAWTPERFSLTEAIRAQMLRYGELVKQDGYRIAFSPDRDAVVFADPLKTSQVIYNLINNALTYTGEDKTVTVRQEIIGGEVEISVIDSGAGIPPEELDTIWQRYYRGTGAHKRAAIGTGLGLSIVRGILSLQSLPYGVESEVGKGSRFYFRLPVAEEGAGTEQTTED